MVHIKFVLFYYMILLSATSIAGNSIKISPQAIKTISEDITNGRYDAELTQNKYHPLLIEIKEGSANPPKFESYNAILWLKKSSVDGNMPELIYTKVNKTSALPLCECCNESFIIEEMSMEGDGTYFTTDPKELLNEFLCHEVNATPAIKNFVMDSGKVPPLCHHFLSTIKTAVPNQVKVTKKSIKESMPAFISILLEYYKATKGK